VMADTPASIAQALAGKPTGSRFYVLAVINENGLTKKLWPDTRKSLIASGFERIVFKGEDEVRELGPIEKLPPKVKNAFLVIDRMSMPENPQKDSRLMDALDQAFQHGSGRVAIALVGKGDESWQYLYFSNKFRCDHCAIDYRTPEPAHFSFNSPLGACPGCSGFGFNLELDEDLVVPDKRKTLKNGAIDPFSKPAYLEWQHDMFKFAEKHKITLGKRYEDLNADERKLLWDGDGSKKGYQGIRGCFEELKAWKYKLHVRVFIRRYQTQKLCMACQGSRLRPESRAVKINGRDLAEILAMSIETSQKYFAELELPKKEAAIAKDALKQIGGRLQFLVDVGTGYLTLNRLGKTLSGGECQRINLATQLGNKLCSTLYVLDEPSIGLHAADTEKLITLLHKLRDHGNTLVVVEHDLDVIAAADHIVEIGPHAGYKGGEVVAQGPLDQILDDKGCLTAKYLTGAFTVSKRDGTSFIRRKSTGRSLKIAGACENNLKDVTVEFPLQQLIAVTGLSGSGKTTLIHTTLYNALARLFHKENVPVGRFQRLYGADLIQDVVLLDQRPIGRSARSNPATYLKIYDDIRNLMSNQSLSIRRGYTPAFFSFNVDGGRCPVCKGEGEITLDMHFMADLKLPCEECEGRKFKKNVLEVEFKRKNIHQILHTTVDECIELFRESPSIVNKLQILRSVGLGYLELGQSSTTLSGGESQRLKVASILKDGVSSNMLYIFDEPTTGLHVDDVKKLLKVMHDLVDQKNTVIVIEHNLELISQADWVIDMGPGGGDHGGQVVATGTPEDIMKEPASLTGKFLKKIDASPNRRILPNMTASGQLSLEA
jgi:excinuclease ABC subunit A